MHNNRLRNRLLRDERGNVAITFGLMVIPMVMVMGLAVDYSEIIRMEQRVQAAADAAALAAINARSQSEENRRSLAIATFRTNVNSAEPSTVPAPTVDFSGQSVTVTGTTDVNMTFSQIFGTEQVTVEKESSAAYETSGFKAEVAMMVDLTGSMGWSSGNGSTRIADLRLAAADLLNILLPTSGANDNAVRVGIAPFADYVNAGSYASAVTGLPSTGVYNNLYNLAQSRNGPFSGSYTGSFTGSAAGSQAGATPATTTFDSGHCANPTITNTSTTNVTYTGRINWTWYTWNVASSWSNVYYQGAVWGYFWVENYQGIPGRWAYGRSWYTPKTVTTSTTSEAAGCETANANTGSLVSCVTERTGADKYTDAAPASGKYIGAYNQSASGVTNKLNYSSDGKCYTAGREMPAVIPLTNNRTTLDTFFTNATVGGGTPGHLGTAWAWYLLSPNWSNVWPSASTPASYSDAGTKKFAIIMTDGEYNMQYSTNASRTQAAELCTAMKAQNIKVFTIGFGFDPAVVAGSNTAIGKAKETLQNCASDSSSYFFPYDGAALRQTFSNIGTSITSGGTTGTNVKLTN